jgi:hypothetical protein
VDRLVVQGLRSPSTAQIYRLNLITHVLPAVGELRLREMTVPRLDRVIQTLQLRKGSATAKIAAQSCQACSASRFGTGPSRRARCGTLDRSPARHVSHPGR